MIHFLENHDEQRIASPEFAGNAQKGKPAMVVSTTISTSPTLVYFGQEFGEPGAEDTGFGKPSRTSIFDYVGVPTLQRWVNNKQFDGGQSTDAEKDLRDFYKRLLNFTIQSSALMGKYQEIHNHNRNVTEGYDHRLLSFARWSDEEQLIIISNFDTEKSYEIELKIPENIVSEWNLGPTAYEMKDQLYQTETTQIEVSEVDATMSISIKPLESFIFKLKK
jgi:glycosidase